MPRPNVDPTEQLVETLEKIGDAFDEFKADIDKRLTTERKEREDLERRLARDRLRGGARDDSPSRGFTGEQTKALADGLRCFIRGDNAAMAKHFAEAGEHKAGSVGVGADGGAFVHSLFSRETTRIALETAPLLEEVRTVPMATGDTFEEIIDKDAAEAIWAGETESRGDTKNPQVGLFTAPLFEIYAQPKATQKLIDTADRDIVAWFIDKIGEAFGNKFADAFINGNGVAKPHGILSYPVATTSDKTRAWGTLQYIPTGASGAFKAAGSDPADCLVDTVAALKAQYRPQARWFMNRITEAAVRKIKDAQGRYILVDSLIAGQPASLLGYPVIPCEQLPDPAANSYSIIFGNMKKGYTSPQMTATRFLADPYTDKPYVKLFAYERIGGAVNNSECFKLVKFGVS